ncbi:MAG TPA: acyl-CoA dehydrogenase family protein [Polyangiales bacterium]|nr:acyl-CoA dehydrogenase family protein [Polyangiales bacterium]
MNPTTASSAPTSVEIAFSEEEAMLAQSAYELLGKRSDLASVRRWLESEGGYDPALYAELAELGWLGAAVPAEYGGAGLGVGALTAVVEAMGKHLFASPFLASSLAAQALLAGGSAAQREQWLPQLVRGQAIGSVALHEPSGSFALAAFGARATRSAAGFQLQGEKTLALDAQHADCVLIAAQLEGAPALFLATRAQLIGRLRRETLIDERRRSARIALDGLELPAEALLDAGGGGDASAAIAHLQRCGYLLVAAEMAGGAEGVLGLTVEYLKTRVQFGRPIGSYQALKHPMVEIMCALEQGRSLLYHAATVFSGADSQSEIALRMAKAQLGDTYSYASDRSIQFHGAIGFTYECHAQLYFRHAQWCQAAFGDSPHHRRALAKLLWPVALPGAAGARP